MECKNTFFAYCPSQIRSLYKIKSIYTQPSKTNQKNIEIYMQEEQERKRRDVEINQELTLNSKTGAVNRYRAYI